MFEELVQRFGCPQFLKIDIEGADAPFWLIWLDCRRDRNTSAETGKESLQGVLQQHQQLQKLGYGRFRVVAGLSRTSASSHGCQW